MLVKGAQVWDTLFQIFEQWLSQFKKKTGRALVKKQNYFTGTVIQMYQNIT